MLDAILNVLSGHGAQIAEFSSLYSCYNLNRLGLKPRLSHAMPLIWVQMCIRKFLIAAMQNSEDSWLHSAGRQHLGFNFGSACASVLTVTSFRP